MDIYTYIDGIVLTGGNAKIIRAFDAKLGTKLFELQGHTYIYIHIYIHIYMYIYMYIRTYVDIV